ncbi:hypothetical protein HMP0721_2450 [Pseudoramibacter alactolyticus ATCC 23263]|uniref:Uncharacterized protein n=1 Tax=Pseudoramibacter alactolyticus ATCC 23263 TaxID=887929 RepID=E6MKB4_9FIRM|nr:hypothetical protein HMP0721_2450 [Pseudoramibacter alactolyticus ATCC 23263]
MDLGGISREVQISFISFISIGELNAQVKTAGGAAAGKRRRQGKIADTGGELAGFAAADALQMGIDFVSHQQIAGTSGVIIIIAGRFGIFQINRAVFDDDGGTGAKLIFEIQVDRLKRLIFSRGLRGRQTSDEDGQGKPADAADRCEHHQRDEQLDKGKAGVMARAAVCKFFRDRHGCVLGNRGRLKLRRKDDLPAGRRRR